MSAPKNILIVDDDEFMRETLTDNFCEKNYNARFVASGEEALEIIHNDEYAYIFLDLKLGGMNGYEAYKELSKLSPTSRILLMTGYFESELVREALREGVHGVIYKPLNIDRVLEQLSGGNKKIVMLVEDDSDSRHGLECILRSHGYYVAVASSYSEAVRLAMEMPPHVLLFDLILQDMSGTDLYITLRDYFPTMKAILMTGFEEEAKALIDRANQEGVICCLRKPFTADELLASIQKSGDS